MADIFAAFACVRREPLADHRLCQKIDQLCHDCQHTWRDRVLTPLVTIRLFILQILHGNTAIVHLRQLSGIAFAAASYCEARRRLPLAVLQSLLHWFAEQAAAIGSAAGLPGALAGGRVVIVDSSSCSMSDTSALRGHFGLPSGVKEGVGYPVSKLMGIIDAATGMFVQLLALPLYVHDMRDVTQLHPLLRPGDILVGDRAFCSYTHLALLWMQGLHGCFRLHQRRKDSGNGLARWKRSDKYRPTWISLDQFKTLPESMQVRLVHWAVSNKGFRTRNIVIVTTLLDAAAWSDEQIANLYLQRWHIETCFNHLKTTMEMDVLKCKTLDGVKKELTVYLLAYNLVRLAMLQAAARQNVAVRSISFVDALRWLCGQLLGLQGVLKLILVRQRPDRYEPRRVRRRAKAYHVLDRPRSNYRQPGPHDGHR